MSLIKRSDALIDQLSRPFGLKCYYCGVDLLKIFNIDHAVSTFSGGSNDISNLRLACQSCNLRKSKLSLEDFRRKDWFWNELGIVLINDTQNPRMCISAIEKLEQYIGEKFDYSDHKFYFETRKKQ